MGIVLVEIFDIEVLYNYRPDSKERGVDVTA